jgi:hypothetical protein
VWPWLLASWCLALWHYRHPVSRCADVLISPRKWSADCGRTPVPCFDDMSPSSRLLVEVHPTPGEIVHTMDVALPELPQMNIQPWVRVRTNRRSGEILCSAAGRMVEDDDGA